MAGIVGSSKYAYMPLVVLNHKAELIGSFDGIYSLTEKLGVKLRTVSTHLYKRKPFRDQLIIPESEYRQAWLENDVQRFCFHTARENLSSGHIRAYRALTDEQKRQRNEKIGRSHRLRAQRTPPDEWRSNRRIPLYCYETDKIYPSASAWCREFGTGQSFVSRCVKLKKSCKGYHLIAVSKEDTLQNVHARPVPGWIQLDRLVGERQKKNSKQNK